MKLLKPPDKSFASEVINFGVVNIHAKIWYKLDPVSRVTGIPGWYRILEIKCSDTMGVVLVYWNSELKSGKGHTPISKEVVTRW